MKHASETVSIRFQRVVDSFCKSSCFTLETLSFIGGRPITEQMNDHQVQKNMSETNTNENEIFRKKSLESLRSPEGLNEYLRVTNPAIWAVLGAVLLLLAALFLWSGFTSFESYVKGKANAQDGVLTILFDDENAERRVETGMTIDIGETQAQITTVGRGADGRVVAGAEASVPDGDYDVKVRYRSQRILSLLFN